MAGNVNEIAGTLNRQSLENDLSTVSRSSLPNDLSPVLPVQSIAQIQNGSELSLHLARSIDKRLSAFFAPSNGEYLQSFTDHNFQQISNLLKGTGRTPCSTVPRLYVVLRTIDCLHVLDTLIDQGITDIWFPFAKNSIPPELPPIARSEFEKAQSLVLTKALDLEKHGQRNHTLFGQGDFIPFEVIGHLGTGAYGSVDKVISLQSGREYARKVFRKGRSATREGINKFLAELRVLKRVNNEHCVELVSSVNLNQSLQSYKSHLLTDVV